MSKYHLQPIPLLVCLVLSMTGAQGKSWGISFHGGKLTVAGFSQSDLRQAERDLSAVDSDHIPKDFEEGLLMDASVVQQLPNDEHGQPGWIVEPCHIYVGKDQVCGSTVKLKSATKSNGGLNLRVGNQYRVFALDMGWLNSGKRSGELFLWKGAALKLKTQGKN